MEDIVCSHTKVWAGVLAHRVSVTNLLDIKYDGDQMNGTLALDHYISDAIQNLAPHKSVLDMSEPRKISKNLSIPKPVISTIANWLGMKEPIDPVKMKRMEQIPALA